MLAVLLLCGAVSAAVAGPVAVGDAFPDFQATDHFTGKPFSLESLRGKVVVVDFWATWCGPCVRELPNVQAAYEKFKGQDIEIVSISLDNHAGRLDKFVEGHEMPWRHVFDGRGWDAKLAKKYGVRSIPRAYVIGRDGKVVADQARGSALERVIESALKTQATEEDAAVAAAAREKLEAVAAEKPAEDTPAKLTDEDQVRIQRWLEIAAGMSENGNDRLARKYYTKVLDEYGNSEYAGIARKRLDSIVD